MISENIRKLREKKGYTQNFLGDVLNLSPSTIGMYEQGRRLPDIGTLIKMCQIFNVSSDSLYEINKGILRYEEFIPKILRSKLLVSYIGPENKEIVYFGYEKIFDFRIANILLDRYSSQDTLFEFLIKDHSMDKPTVAEITRIRKTRLDDILSGKSPNINELILLSECFGESTDYILCLTDEHIPRAKIRMDVPSFQSQLITLMDDYNEFEIANELDISISRLRKFLSGDDIPSPEHIKKLSDLFCVSTDFLLGIRNKTRERLSSNEYPFPMDKKALSRIQTILGSDTDEYIAEILGLTTTELFHLYHYGFLPHIAVIKKLCEMGNVSSDYLLGFSDSPLVIQKSKETDEDALLKDYRKLGIHYRKKIDGMISEQILQQERDNFMKISVAADEPEKMAK